jgi:uncharacterized protein (DUF433 family)
VERSKAILRRGLPPDATHFDRVCFQAMANFLWLHCPDVECSPDTLSGEWCVKGTHVSVQAVLDNTADGFTAEQIATQIYDLDVEVVRDLGLCEIRPNVKRNAEAAAKAVRMLDLLSEFFNNGRHWIKDEFHDDDGNRCLISAMAHLRAVTNLHGDPTSYYLREAQPQWRYKALIAFMTNCQSYDTIRALIARALALADMLQLTRKPTTVAARRAGSRVTFAVRYCRKEPQNRLIGYARVS